MNNQILFTCLVIARHYLPKHSRKNGYKHYSFVIQKNALMEWATNKSGPPLKMLGYEEFQMLHSETQAYKKAKGLLHKEPFEVINIRLNSKGEMKISKPCSCCIAFLKSVGCKKIWFSADYKELSEDLFLKLIL